MLCYPSVGAERLERLSCCGSCRKALRRGRAARGCCQQRREARTRLGGLFSGQLSRSPFPSPARRWQTLMPSPSLASLLCSSQAFQRCDGFWRRWAEVGAANPAVDRGGARDSRHCPHALEAADGEHLNSASFGDRLVCVL
ncbi:hypothetical protein BS78_09G053000 [Paspalum vaginatum]|nr:hypothetical protein BS78_09G053000 [Paspalum vaginatum]